MNTRNERRRRLPYSPAARRPSSNGTALRLVGRRGVRRGRQHLDGVARLRHHRRSARRRDTQPTGAGCRPWTRRPRLGTRQARCASAPPCLHHAMPTEVDCATVSGSATVSGATVQVLATSSVRGRHRLRHLARWRHIRPHPLCRDDARPGVPRTHAQLPGQRSGHHPHADPHAGPARKRSQESGATPATRQNAEASEPLWRPGHRPPCGGRRQGRRWPTDRQLGLAPRREPA